MVFAFVLQTASSTSCDILYSRVFHHQNFVSEPDVQHVPASPEELPRELGRPRTRTKDALQSLASRVHAEYEFLRTCAETSKRKQGGGGEGGAPTILPELETGMFFVTDRFAEPFFEAPHADGSGDNRRVVVWCGSQGVAAMLVLDNSRADNRILANVILKHVARQLEERCCAFSRPQEVLLKPDVVHVVMDAFLPDGQLLFGNHRTVQELERQLETTIRSMPK